MIRKLLATTAIVTVAATGAYAAETSAATDGQASERFLPNASDATLASQLIGETVYTSTAEDAESVGEIDDLVVGDDGDVDAAIVAVGGFLGIGEKYVAINLDSLKLTAEDDGSQYVVLQTSKEELEAAPEFDLQAAKNPDMQRDAAATDSTAAEGAMTRDNMAARETAPSDEMAPTETAPSNEMAANEPTAEPMAPAGATGASIPSREQLRAMENETVGTDDLIGAAVYSQSEENVGEVGEVVVTEEGEIDAVVIDVGGFLGIGEKPVAVAFADLELMQDDSGNVYIYTTFTQDQLEAAAQYDKNEYKQNRDRMLMKTAG